MYMLDSCICIDFMRGRLPYGYRMLQLSDPRLYAIPAIVEAELRCGAEKSANPERNRRTLETFLLPFRVVPFDSTCAAKYAKLRAQLESKGRKIGPNNMLIAATALAYDAVLVSNNNREFKRVSGLTVESWYEEDLPKGAMAHLPKADGQ